MMKIKITIALIFVAFAAMVVYTLYKAGSFKTIEPHYEGDIIGFYTNMSGPEDIDISFLKNTIFISSTDRRDRNQEGNIFKVDLDNATLPDVIPHTYSESFHPHGISVLDLDSTTYLHVVNHNEKGDFIEFFKYSDDTLFHLKSVRSTLMCCPNDVVAVAPERCYITNDHGNKTGFMRTMEDYLSLPMSSILYFDGNKMIEAFDGLRYANGINISLDGKFLYATETTGRKMLTLAPNSDGTLHKIGEVNLKTGLDNIDVDREGNIWIGSHPKLLAFVSHAGDSTALSPSQVLKLSPNTSNPTKYMVKEIILDDGSNLSGSSVAVHHQGKVYVGVVFDSKVMQFNLK